MTALKKGTEVTVVIPFSYTIGEVGYHTGKILETVEDCEQEVRAEMESGVIAEGNFSLESKIENQ